MQKGIRDARAAAYRQFKFPRSNPLKKDYKSSKGLVAASDLGKIDGWNDGIDTVYDKFYQKVIESLTEREKIADEQTKLGGTEGDTKGFEDALKDALIGENNPRSDDYLMSPHSGEYINAFKTAYNKAYKDTYDLLEKAGRVNKN